MVKSISELAQEILELIKRVISDSLILYEQIFKLLVGLAKCAQITFNLGKGYWLIICNGSIITYSIIKLGVDVAKDVFNEEWELINLNYSID